MARVFIDVGGYLGDSVYAALDPLFGFDHIYTFEPVTELAQALRRINYNQVAVIEAGLFDTTTKRPIYHAGTLAGSIYLDSPAYLEEGGVQECVLIEASEFFRKQINVYDVVFMKLNCEGAECAILENLLLSKEIRKLTEVLVDFDALKIPSQAHRVTSLIERLQSDLVPYHTPEQVQFGMINNYGAIRNWLLVTGAAQPGVTRRLRSIIYQMRIMLTKNYSGYYKMRVLRMMPWLKPVIRQLRGRSG